ncbi:MAG: hypothetical protein ABR597_06765 [Bacteroidales bacterium]
MSLSQTKENIVNLLENIIKRTELIERQSGSRNLLEIDLAMEDVRSLYRELELMRKLSEAGNLSEAHVISGDHDKTKEAPQKAYEEPVKDVIKEENPVNQEKETKPEPVAEEKPKDIVKDQEKQPEKPEIEKPPVVSKSAKAEPEKTAAESGQQNSTIVAEKFSNNKSSLHERLVQIKEDKSIGARMQYKPVKNIKEAIGVNEKFLFINELFNGDLKSYNEAVEKLNQFPSIHEAFEFLNKLTYEFQWDGQRSADTIEKFANLVQRRYM